MAVAKPRDADGFHTPGSDTRATNRCRQAIIADGVQQGTPIQLKAGVVGCPLCLDVYHDPVMSAPLPLRLFREVFGMYKLAPTAPLPEAVRSISPCFVARTATELSVIVPLGIMPLAAERFRLLKIDMTFGTTEVGVLRRIVDPLADAQVWILALGTHDTDYALVREDQLADALLALRQAGHRVTEPDEAEPPAGDAHT